MQFAHTLYQQDQLGTNPSRMAEELSLHLFGQVCITIFLLHSLQRTAMTFLGTQGLSTQTLTCLHAWRAPYGVQAHVPSLLFIHILLIYLVQYRYRVQVQKIYTGRAHTPVTALRLGNHIPYLFSGRGDLSPFSLNIIYSFLALRYLSLLQYRWLIPGTIRNTGRNSD